MAKDADGRTSMAIINCPECGRQISDTSSICPACGYTFPRKKAIRDGAKIKTGAIVNVIGGFGFAATWALLSVFASAENDRSGGVEVSVSTSTFDNPDLAGIVFVVFLASIVVVTAISIAMLFIKKPTRKKMIALSSVQLAFALLENVPWIVLFNFLICCGMWLYTWGILLQFIGSVICMRGALKIE